MNQPPEREPKREATPGQVVGGKWRVVRVIGRGGMGAVYEAQNIAIGKRAALKFIDAEYARREDVASRFRQEAEAASLVESAHIVEVFDSGTTEEGIPYIVMELLRGEDLRTRLRRVGKLPASDAVHIIGQVLRGLHRAHEAGIVHRDLKPDNVFLLDRDDDSLFVKLVDFGISKITRPRVLAGDGPITSQGVVLGTPAYMSPEQTRGLADVDARTDLWAAGAILFECLVGRAPFAGEFYESLVVAVCTTEAPSLTDLDPTISPALAGIVRRALARDRALRYQSAAQFLDALQEAGFAVARRNRQRDGHDHPSGPGEHERAVTAFELAPRAEPGDGGALPAPRPPTAPTQQRRSFARIFGLALGVTVTSFCLTLAGIRTFGPSRGPRQGSARPSAEASIDGAQPRLRLSAAEEARSAGAALPTAAALAADTPDAAILALAPESAASVSSPSAAASPGHVNDDRAPHAKATSRAKVTTAAASAHSGGASGQAPRAGVARGLEIKTTYP